MKKLIKKCEQCGEKFEVMPQHFKIKKLCLVCQYDKRTNYFRKYQIERRKKEIEDKSKALKKAGKDVTSWSNEKIKREYKNIFNA